MVSIDNKVGRVAIKRVTGDEGVELTIRRSYVPFGGVVAVMRCECGQTTKENLDYQGRGVSVVDHKELSCSCGNQIRFSYRN